MKKTTNVTAILFQLFTYRNAFKFSKTYILLLLSRQPKEDCSDYHISCRSGLENDK